MDALPDFHLDDHGFCWVAQARLASWAGFQDRSGGYGSLASSRPADGEVEIVFAPEGRGPEPLTEPELGLIGWFLAHEPAVSDAVKSAIVEEYPRLLDLYDYSPEERAELMPEISGVEDLKALIGLHSVHVHQIARDGMPYVGFEFGCTWDIEHGLGVLMHGTRKVQVEGADTAILLWIAEEDAAQP